MRAALPLELGVARVCGSQEAAAAADPLAVVLQQELIRLAHLLAPYCCASPLSHLTQLSARPLQVPAA